MASVVYLDKILLRSGLIVNILLQCISGQGTHYFKTNSIRCHSTGKFTIKHDVQTICAAVCEEYEDKLCMGFQFENLSCELCTVCPETTTRNISMFSINYEDEFTEGKCLKLLIFKSKDSNMFLFKNSNVFCL